MVQHSLYIMLVELTVRVMRMYGCMLILVAGCERAEIQKNPCEESPSSAECDEYLSGGSDASLPEETYNSNDGGTNNGGSNNGSSDDGGSSNDGGSPDGGGSSGGCSNDNSPTSVPTSEPSNEELDNVASATTSPGSIIEDFSTSSSSVYVHDCGSILDIRVDVDITHDLQSELFLSLHTPHGFEITLFSGGDQNCDGTADFDPWSPPNVADLVGSFYDGNGSLPFCQSFSQLYGQTSAGLWTLDVSDLGTMSTTNGRVNSWGMEITCD